MTSVHGGNRGDGDVYPVSPLTGDISPVVAGVPVDNRTLDSMTVADQSAVDSVIANAAFPNLSMPLNFNSSSNGDPSVSSVSAATFGLTTMQQIEDIKMGVLEGWSKNLREIAAREESDRQSPEYKGMLERQSSQYLAELARMSPEASINAALNNPEFMKLLNQLPPIDKTQLTESTRAYATISGLESYAAQRGAAAAGLLGMMGGVGGVAMIETVVQGNALIESVSQIASSAATAAQQIVQATAAGIQIDYNALLAMMGIGAFFAERVLQFTTAETVTGAAGKSDKPKDLAFALKFADNVITLSKDPGFNQFIQNHIITKMPGSELLTQQQKDILTAMVKVVLLASAVAMLSKGETGWINPTEFKDRVNGKIKTDYGAEDVRTLLLGALQTQFKVLDDAGATKSKNALINALAAVFTNLNTDGKRVIDDRMAKVGQTMAGVGQYLDSQRPISASASG